MWNRGDKTWHLTTINPALVASADYLISHNISHHQTSTSQKLSAPQANKTSYLQKKIGFHWTASLCCFQNERIATWYDHHQHPHDRNNDHWDDIIIIISRKMSSYRRTIRMTAAPPLAGGALKLQGEKKTFVLSELVRTFISFIIWGSYEYHPLSSGVQAVC